MEWKMFRKAVEQVTTPPQPEERRRNPVAVDIKKRLNLNGNATLIDVLDALLERIERLEEPHARIG